MSTAWEEIQSAVAGAPYPTRILPGDPERGQHCLTELEITERSWLGAVTRNSGGLLIDHGWLRVLGCGAEGLPDVLERAHRGSGGLIIGYDVLGGEFAWLQAEAGAPPTVHYFGPDLLEWQDLGNGYADWLHAMIAGAMPQFYENLRWPGWEAEVAALRLDQGISTFPPPWTAEGKDLGLVSRKAIPIQELIAFHGSGWPASA